MLQIINLNLTTSVHGKPVDMLRGISLSVAKGTMLGLVGESGAGKSMIGRLVAGHVPDTFDVTKGRVLFDGEELLAMRAAERRKLLGRRIAFIPQEPLTALNPLLTIGQTFGEYLGQLDVAASERRAAMLAQLASVRLPNPEEIIRRYPHELSGGQCQRVLIAMAFASDPELIVADEPTTALDVVSQARVMSLLAEKQRQHRTAVILITHDLRMAAHVCDDIAVLYAGEIVEYGPAKEVLRRPLHPYTCALHDATPDLHGPRVSLPHLPGQMPGAAQLADIAGCRFASRCPTRDASCEHTVPTLTELSAGHYAACASACITPACAPAFGAVTDGPAVNDAKPMPGADQDAAPIVELRAVSLRYTAKRGMFGSRRTVFTAVDGISLAIRPGEFVGIVGESGSGKSSIARLIVGAESPTLGAVLVNGTDRRNAGTAALKLAREHVQMVFQDPHSALNPRRTVRSLLTQAYDASPPAAALLHAGRTRAAQRLAQEVGLPDDCMSRFPMQLSGGQKQRVNIGRALCMMPRLVVADEIVSGLDVSIQAQILNLLLELGRKHGIALVLISHDLSVVRYLCSRVVVMQEGKIVEQGPTTQVFEQPRHAYTRLLLGAVPSDDPSQPWPPSQAAV